MLFFIAKIILMGSILGMGIMAGLKVPALRALPVGKRQSNLEIKISLPKARQKARQAMALSKKILKRNFSGLKHMAKSNSKTKQIKLSADYWEKIRKGK